MARLRFRAEARAKAREDLIAKAIVIATSVALRHGMSLKTILCHDNRPEVHEVRRQAVVAVHAELPGMSFAAIGRVFRRDHTTILSTLGRLRSERKQYQTRTDTDPAVAALREAVLALRAEGFGPTEAAIRLGIDPLVASCVQRWGRLRGDPRAAPLQHVVDPARAARNERILNLWHVGRTSSAIGRLLGLTNDIVLGVVAVARTKNDPRAHSRDTARPRAGITKIASGQSVLRSLERRAL